MTGTARSFDFCAAPAEDGQRLDVVIAAHLADCSRSAAGHAIRSGHVQIGGRVRKKAAYRVKSGDAIRGHLPAAEIPTFSAQPIDLDILYEDVNLLVINKPAGMVVHPAPGHAGGTLVNALLFHFPQLAPSAADNPRPGIVHRLDKDTSGCLLVAKSQADQLVLSRQFALRQVKKTYLALVRGQPAGTHGQIDLPVGRHTTDRKKMSTHSPRGRTALTYWKIRERLPCAALLEVSIKSGRTHQIRVHLAAVGHPVVGDPVYGGRKHKYAPADPLQTARRQMLHARRLEFIHPRSGRRLSFTAPLPNDMQHLLERLRQATSRDKDL